MNQHLSKWILALAMVLSLSPSAWTQSTTAPVVPPAWPVSSAPARFTIQSNYGGPTYLLSWVKLYLPDPKWITNPLRVFNDKGVAVGSDVLWTAPGDPVTLLFDSSSGSKRYQVYVGSNWPAMHIPDARAGDELECRAGDGRTINSLPEMLQAWNQSKTVLGRAILVEGLDEGGNRFGPQVNLLDHFQGWFDVATPEHLELATVSVDASFVLVDGKEVVEWPGLHDRYFDPVAGPPHGAIDLQPGLHSIDYYYSYTASPGGNPPVMASLVAKGGSYTDWTVLAPQIPFFRIADPYHAVSYELQPGSSGTPATANVPGLAIDCTQKDQSVIYTDLPDIGLISLQLTCLVPAKDTLTWTFDDGSTAQGQSIVHLFPRPGLRTVHLSLTTGGRQVAALTQTINVHADWAHPANQPQLLDEHQADIMGRDPATLPASDLVSCVAVFRTYLESDDIVKLVPAVCAKMSQISDTDLPYINDAAAFLVRFDSIHYPEEIQLYRALLARCSSGNPSSQLIAISTSCRLRLAQLILRTTDHTDEVKSLINAIDVHLLTDGEPRAFKILRGDLMLATGDVAGAQNQYENLTGNPDGADARSSIRRTAKIGQARAFIDRQDFGAAEDALSEVARQSPIEKMAPDWALTQLRLYQEQKLTAVAYLWAKRLLPVITESGRSELLFRLTDLAFAQGDNDLAHKTLSELLQKHPYSQEAAQAKEKWPTQE